MIRISKKSEEFHTFQHFEIRPNMDSNPQKNFNRMHQANDAFSNQEKFKQLFVIINLFKQLISIKHNITRSLKLYCKNIEKIEIRILSKLMIWICYYSINIKQRKRI